MRVGDNPVRHQQLDSYGRHRIIIPFYVPKLDDYYAEVTKVIDICLESLKLTAGGRVAVTLISNAAVTPVVERLQRAFDEGWVDQLILHGENRGKVDAVAPVARACFEELVSVADCDVLFLPGWVDAMEELFAAFPECGFASPNPSPQNVKYYTSGTIVGAMLRREMTRAGVVPREDLERFAVSINRPDMHSERALSRQVVVRRNGVTACVGAGHFVFTMRRGLVQQIPEEPSKTALSGTSEKLWFDAPGDKVGAWRLSTHRAYAHHMGNSPEPWMYEELEACRAWAQKHANGNGASAPVLPPLRPHWTARVSQRTRQRVVGLVRRAGFLE